MSILGWLVIIFVVALIIGIRAERKQKKEEIYYNDISIKALRNDELIDLIGDPSVSEVIRDAAKDQYDWRVRHGDI